MNTPPIAPGSGSRRWWALGGVMLAVFGSALSSVYQGYLPIAGLPGAAVATMKEGLSQGLGVARLLGSPRLVHGVQSAFVQGMDAAFLVSAGIVGIGLVLTLVFMPRRTPALTTEGQSGGGARLDGGDRRRAGGRSRFPVKG